MVKYLLYGVMVDLDVKGDHPSIRPKNQLLLPGQLVAKASTYHSELMSLIRSQLVSRETHQCLHWACPRYSFETCWLEVFALRRTQAKQPHNAYTDSAQNQRIKLV